MNETIKKSLLDPSGFVHIPKNACTLENSYSVENGVISFANYEEGYVSLFSPVDGNVILCDNSLYDMISKDDVISTKFDLKVSDYDGLNLIRFSVKKGE